MTFPLLLGVMISAMDAFVLRNPIPTLDELEFKFSPIELKRDLTAKNREVNGSDRGAEKSGRARK